MNKRILKVGLVSLAATLIGCGEVNASAVSHSSSSIVINQRHCKENAQKLYQYLITNTKLNHNAAVGVCAVAVQQTGMDVNNHQHGFYGILAWKNKPIPMNGNRKMSKFVQQELYLKDTINPKLINELNSQKDAESAAKTFAKEYCHIKQKVNWMKYVNQVNKEN